MSELPVTPVGPTILLKAKQFENKTESGIIHTLKDETNRETAGQHIFECVAQGDLAYKDHPQYGNTKLCEIGDWVMCPRYPGIKHEYPKGSGQIYWLANDDDVKAVIPKENLKNFDLGGAA